MLGSCSIASDNTIECYDDKSVPWTVKPKRRFTVTVEGNIGSGKSTFLQYFKPAETVEVIPEPVDLWQNVGGWYNTLDLLYKDARRWSLAFQSYVQLTMLQNHTRRQTKPVKMLERSIFSARYCFVENLHQTGRMSGLDYAVISEWFDWVLRGSAVTVDLIVYLQASPLSCMQRIKKRNREEESSVPMDYLESLHELHEDWLVRQTRFSCAAPVLVIDASKNLAEMELQFEQKREEILCGQI